jgi:hypothetical protein
MKSLFSIIIGSALAVLAMGGLVACHHKESGEQAKVVIIYNPQGEPKAQFTNVTIYRMGSNYIDFKAGDVALYHKGLYKIEK